MNSEHRLTRRTLNIRAEIAKFVDSLVMPVIMRGVYT